MSAGRARFGAEASNLALGIGTLAITLPISVLVARVLGPEGRGVLALLTMSSAIAALVVAGGYPDLAPAAVGGGGGVEAARVFERRLWRRVVPLAVLWGVGVGAVLWRAAVEGSASLAAAAALLVALGAAWPFYLQVGAALARVRLPAKAEAFRVGVYAMVALALVVAGWLTPLTATLAFVVSYLAGELVVRHRMGLRTARALPPAEAEALGTGAGRGGRDAVVGRLLEYAATRADVMLVGALLGARAAGLYAVAVAVSEPLLLAANAAAAPVLAQVVRAEAPAAVRAFVRSRLALALGVAGAGAIVLALLAPLVVRLAFGEAFTEAVVPMRILGGAYAIGCGVRLLRTVNIGRARLRENWWADGAAITVLVAGDLLFVPRGGLAAAAVVTTAAAACALGVLAWRGRAA